MNTKPTQLIDMIGRTISILGKEFTVDWMDKSKSKDDGMVMVISAENVVYYIGDKAEALADVMSEISSELMRMREAKE